MTKTKKALALILCLVMCLSMLPTWAVAEEVNPAEEEVVAELQEENPAEISPTAVFILHTEPEGAYVRVYSLDENGAETDAYPDETGAYILAPGEYCYDVSAEGYQAMQGERIQLAAAEAPTELTVVLEPEVQEPAPEEAATEAETFEAEPVVETAPVSEPVAEEEVPEVESALVSEPAAEDQEEQSEEPGSEPERMTTEPVAETPELEAKEEQVEAAVSETEANDEPAALLASETDTVEEAMPQTDNSLFPMETVEADLMPELFSTAGVTQAAAVAWANAQIGKTLDYDGVYGGQCVDLIYFYYQALGATVLGGNAIDYASNALPAGWQRIAYSAGVKPEPGDIAVWSGWNNPNGHVAIVDSADDVAMNVVEQNFNYEQVVRKNWTKYSGSRHADLVCFIRPDFVKAQQPIGAVDDMFTWGDGAVRMTGWAFDPDVPSMTNLLLDVFVGGDYTSGKRYRVECNAHYRPDINNLYGVGDYHGFALVIPVEERGSQPIYVYAVDAGDTYAGNVLIGSGTLNITADHAREISVSPSSMTLGVESTKKLFVSYLPYDTVNKSVTWSSKNTSVATIDSNGLVTGKAPGTTTITATVAGGATASCTVTVQVMQTKINLDQTEISIPLGSLVEVGMSVSGAPDGAYVRWSPPAGSGAWNGTLILSDQGTAWTIHGKTGEENYFTHPEDKVYIGAGPYSLNYGGNRIKAGATYEIPISCNGASAILHITYVNPLIPVSSLKLDKTRVTMALGEELPLSAVMTPSNTTVDYIYWRKTGDSISLEPSGYMFSRGEKVGTVADYQSNTQGWSLYPTLVKMAPIHEAVIKAEALGTSTITVETVGGATATCEVTVVDAIPVSSVSLNKTSLSLIAGRSETLTASVSPTNATDKSLSWSSSNPAVATVSNGRISAVSPGTAVITASAKNGVKASCTVQVLFQDVSKPSEYYYAPVYWAVDNGITTGRTPTTFDPYGQCTRGHIVTFLWRAMGEPEPSIGNPFVDVNPGDSYYNAVLWAYENGITTGQTPTTFGPWKPCTRGQIVTFLWRAMGEPGVSQTNKFTDVKPDDYYYYAVRWAAENGITTGKTPTTFEPYGTCTRGQAVTFIYRAKN